MTKELIINTTARGVDIALLEDKKLVELHSETNDASFTVGDIYLGKVKKLIPGLNAAFVDVGFEKDAFLHYTDLSPFIKSILKFTQMSMQAKEGQMRDFKKFTVEPEIVKTGKITEVLNGKPNVLVQILKEPIAAKGPRLSCELSLAGRYVVVTPFNNMVAVSRKIQSSQERKRLQKIVEGVRPNNLGVIIRTAAEGQDIEELHRDLLDLEATWKQIQQNLLGATPSQKIWSEQGKTNSILRDLMNADFNKIVIDDKDLYNETKTYLEKIAPDKKDIVSYYSNGTEVFDNYGINKQVKASFGKSVNLPSGAYLIIEHTEALHVIDVNSGYKSVGNNQEQNALETNLEAAQEIARQMRLRDIGGIIVVDFIDMKLPENRKNLCAAMDEFMKGDRARHSVLPLTKFGLMQITRQRMKPEMNINTSEVCPSCDGKGKVSSTVILEDDIAKNLSYLIMQKHKGLTIEVHPIIYSYLTSGFPSIRLKWMWKYKQNIKVKANSNNHFLQFTFIDEKGEEIKL